MTCSARSFGCAISSRTRAASSSPALRGRVPAIGRVCATSPRTSTRRSGEELAIAQSSRCRSAANGAGFARRSAAYIARRRSVVAAAHAPLARQIDLEHVAGVKIVVDARDAVEECGGASSSTVNVVRPATSTPGKLAARSHRNKRRAVRRDPLSATDRDAAVGVIDDDRRRTAQRERYRHRALRRRRQAQRRFDLTARARSRDRAPSRRWNGNRGLARALDVHGLPGRIERVEKRRTEHRAARRRARCRRDRDEARPRGNANRMSKRARAPPRATLSSRRRITLQGLRRARRAADRAETASSA